MKTIQLLKRAIENKNLEDSLIVLKWTDVPFVAFQYLNAIAKFKNLEIKRVEEFDEVFKHTSSSLFDFASLDYLQVYVEDTFKTKLVDNLKDLKNVIVICKSIDDKIIDRLKENEMYFEIPKLQDWQIKDYIHTQCPGLSQAKINWLYDSTEGNIYRMSQEAKKISCFDGKIQDEVFDMIDNDGGYEDLTQNKIFDLTNAVLAKDLNKVATILKDIEHMDVEGYGLVTILKNSFKTVIEIQLDNTATAEKLGIKPARFNIVKAKNCGRFTSEKLMSIYKFLSDFDSQLKNGKFEISKDSLIDYIICEVLS